MKNNVMILDESLTLKNAPSVDLSILFMQSLEKMNQHEREVILNTIKIANVAPLHMTVSGRISNDQIRAIREQFGYALQQSFV